MVALIGAGAIGAVHANSLFQMQGVKLQAVCDIHFDRAKKIADKHEATAYTELEALIASPEWRDIQVVLVCIPTYLHEDVVLLVAGYGKHIFCEKPIALDEQAAKRMIKACEANHVLLGVGHVVRFFPEYLAARDKYRSADIGMMGTIRTHRGGPFPYGWNNWYGVEEQSGGILVDLLIHDLDFIDAMIDPIEHLYARRIRSSQREERDYALIIGRLQCGALFHMEATWAHMAGFRYGFEYAGSRGIIQFDSEKAPPLTLTTQAHATQPGAGSATVPESPFLKSPYQIELEAFFDAMISRREPPVTGLDALRALQLSLAARTSAESQRPVYV